MSNTLLKGVSTHMTSNKIYFYTEGEEEDSPILELDVCASGLTSIPRIGETIHFRIDDNGSDVYKVKNIENYIYFKKDTRSGYQHIYVTLEKLNMEEK